MFSNYANNCKSFFKCQAGYAHQISCGHGLAFNEQTNYCDWEFNVQCRKPGNGGSSGGSGHGKYQLPVYRCCSLLTSCAFIFDQLIIFFRVVLVSRMEQCLRIMRAVAKHSIFVIMVDLLNHAVKDVWYSTNVSVHAIGHKTRNAFVTINASAIQYPLSIRHHNINTQNIQRIHRYTNRHQMEIAITIMLLCHVVHHSRVRLKIASFRHAFHTMNSITNCNLLH